MAGLLAASTTPLAGRAKWALDYGETICTLSRTFAAKNGRDVKLIVRSTPLRGSYTVTVVLPDEGGGLLRGGITVSFGGEPPQEVLLESYPAAAASNRIWRFGIQRDAIGAARSDAMLTLTPSRGTPVALSMEGGDRAWAALDACGVDLLQRWGVDPDEKAKIARPPEAIGDEAMFLRSEDYPVEAIRHGAQGNTRLFFTIGSSGAVTECRVVEGSGVEVLDRASCAALMRRGRYSPAIGKDGQAMITHKTRSVLWRLPGVWKTDAAYRRIMAEQMRALRDENGMR